jgi:hypothetical protein
MTLICKKQAIDPATMNEAKLWMRICEDEPKFSLVYSLLVSFQTRENRRPLPQNTSYIISCSIILHVRALNTLSSESLFCLRPSNFCSTNIAERSKNNSLEMKAGEKNWNQEIESIVTLLTRTHPNLMGKSRFASNPTCSFN